MAKMRLALVQIKCQKNPRDNISHATEHVQKAAQEKAQVILLPELFETQYFPREKNKEFFSLAHPYNDHPMLNHFQDIAKSLKVILPISFFEKKEEKYFNSLAFINAEGEIQGIYRKTFIPSGPGYEEKYYFSSGDTGFKVWETPLGKIGVGICWDQWFPECARQMTLMGADLLLYPTCIGSEPEEPNFDTSNMWQKVMIGHTVANIIPIGAANRTGTEGNQTYYGSSFLASHRGDIITEASRTEETILYANLDFQKIRQNREDFGLIGDLKKYHQN